MGFAKGGSRTGGHMRTRILGTTLALMVFASVAWAEPILNDGIETYERRIGSTWQTVNYGTYANSGDLLFLTQGNEEGAGQYAMLQSIMFDIYGVDLVRAETGVEYTGQGGTSGTWAVTEPVGGLLNFYTVKAGNYFAMYQVTPPTNTGSWSTYHIFIPGTLTSFSLVDGEYQAILSEYGGHPNHLRGEGVEISHFWGYNVTSQVPEPATFMMIGMGILGLAFYGSRRKKR
jgi:hypothetical protein